MNELRYEEKKKLRRKILDERRALTEEAIKERSGKICDRFLALPILSEASKVCIYMPINNEVDVSLMTDRLRSLGKTLYIPKVGGSSMHFHLYEPDTALSPGSFGILEPCDSPMLSADADTLIVMPGACFSEGRDRIGYGGGYYDRYIKKHPDVLTVAVAYDLQVLPEIPSAGHDQKPMILLTETRQF